MTNKKERKKKTFTRTKNKDTKRNTDCLTLPQHRIEVGKKRNVRISKRPKKKKSMQNILSKK